MGGTGLVTSTRFMILGIGRSGSTHLERLLNSHPDIRCYGELFTPGHRLFEDSGTKDHHEYLDSLAAEAGTPVMGFKHMWPGLYAWAQTLDLFHDPAMKIIRLRRLNLLALHVSTLFVTASGVGHSTQGEYTVDQVHVDIDACFADLHNCYFVDRILDELSRHNPLAHISYEHLVDNEQEVMRGLQAFLGVEPLTLESPMKRMRNRSLRDSIENWDEVATALRGTVWESFLDEVPAGTV
jgi:hypothetical protein